MARRWNVLGAGTALAMMVPLGLLTACGSSDSGADKDTAATTAAPLDEADVEVEAEVATTVAASTTTEAGPVTTTAPLVTEVDSMELTTKLDAQGLAVDPTDTFTPDTGTIYLVVRLVPLAANDKVHVSWAYEGEQVAQYTHSQPTASEDVPVGFTASSANVWPAGQYSATVTVNDVEVGVETFTIS